MTFEHMVRYLRTAASLDPVIGHLPQDGSLQFTLLDRTVDLRLATAPCSGAEKLALRLLDPSSMEHRISDEQTLRGHLRQRGIHTLLQDGLTKARTGVTSLEELQTLASHPRT